jgi:hypothetical protein
MWNKFPKARLSLDDVIELRIMEKPSLAADLKRWTKDPCSYGTEFHARVKRIILSAEKIR